MKPTQILKQTSRYYHCLNQASVAARVAGAQRNNLRDFRNKNITVNKQFGVMQPQSMLARAFACKLLFVSF